MVEVSLTVGKLDASLALLLTKEHHLIEFPTVLLPSDVEAGSIVKISCERDKPMEEKDNQVFQSIQDQILASFGTKSPLVPNLRVRNVTQTSVVLEWDQINPATAEVISLNLYKNGTRFGAIPTPLKRTATKLSGLSIDTAYSFYLVLTTTGGTFTSNEINVKTHKMTDLTGITICVGSLDDTDIDRSDLEETVKKIGAKPLQDSVKLDTTHFICTVGEGPHWKRAQDLNIPIVRPEWIKACEAERRLVGVRAYYLTADPKLRPPVHRPRASSYATQISSEMGAPSAASISNTVGSDPNSSSGTPVANSANAGNQPISDNGNVSKHRRAVSEIQDSPLPTTAPASSNHPAAPVIEEAETEEEVSPIANTTENEQETPKLEKEVIPIDAVKEEPTVSADESKPKENVAEIKNAETDTKSLGNLEGKDEISESSKSQEGDLTEIASETAVGTSEPAKDLATEIASKELSHDQDTVKSSNHKKALDDDNVESAEVVEPTKHIKPVESVNGSTVSEPVKDLEDVDNTTAEKLPEKSTQEVATENSTQDLIRESKAETQADDVTESNTKDLAKEPKAETQADDATELTEEPTTEHVKTTSLSSSSSTSTITKSEKDDDKLDDVQL